MYKRQLDILMQDNLLLEFHGAHTQYADWTPFLPLLAHSIPGLRVLEIGAGTGSATAMALEHLRSKDGSRMYGEYFFTDISSGFMAAAKERFLHEHRIEYRVLDISLDPMQQGFEAHSFDLVIASNVSNLSSIWGSLLTIANRSYTQPQAFSHHYAMFTAFSSLQAGSYFTKSVQVCHAHGSRQVKLIIGHRTRNCGTDNGEINSENAHPRQILTSTRDHSQAGGSVKRMIEYTSLGCHLPDGIGNCNLQDLVEQTSRPSI